MKKISRRSFLQAAAVTAAVGALTACGGGTEGTTAGGASGTASAVAGEPDISEHVVLTYYCIGDEGSIHADEHIDMINQYLTEKLNCELSPQMVSWGEYRQKFPLIWASGEAFDLTFAGNWAGYSTEAPKGAFMDVSELLPVYAPTTWATMQEKGLDESLRMNGAIYAIPEDNPDYTTFLVNYREDLRKKYNCPEIVDEETLRVYLEALKQNEPGMQPYGDNGIDNTSYTRFLNEQNWSRPLDNANGFLVYALEEPNHVFNVAKTPEYKEFVTKMNDYYNLGYVSQSIMANTDALKDSFEAGRTGTYHGNFSNSNIIINDLATQHPDWKIGYYTSDLNDGLVERTAPINNSISIGAYSKHPDRALMFLELLNTDRTFYNLVMYGIEGVTYEWDEASNTKWTPEGADPSELSLRNIGMGLARSQFVLDDVSENEIIKELKAEYEKCAIDPALFSFTLNQDPIAAELAAMKAVQDEFKLVLDKGAAGDVDAALATLNERLESAGIADVEAEINAQITAYLAD